MLAKTESNTNNVKPKEIRKNFTIGIYNAAGERVYGDMICSVQAFSTGHKGKDTENIVVALMCYSDAVSAQFPN